METKANPNATGCLAKALPTEPFFVLLARDRATPATIRFWGEERARLGIESEERMDAEQLTEAFDLAEAMTAWRADNEGTWRNVPEPAEWLIWSNEHGAWWRPAKRGYTTVIAEAGLYPKSLADMICENANWGSQINEVAVPAPPQMLVPAHA